MAKLDSLIVDLQLNTAELRKGLDEANNKLDGFGKKLNDLAGVVVFEKMATMALAAGKSLVHFVASGAEAADRMGKLAQSAGMTVESFSAMNYAAGLSLLTVEQFSVGMVKLNKNIADAATGQKEQSALFHALGVSVRDAAGQVKGADAVFKELATKFQAMSDGASKVKLATELFGKSGADMIPMLNQGAEGIAQMTAEADKFGLTVSASAAASAEQFNDNLFRMKQALEAVARGTAAELTPALVELTNQFLANDAGASTLSDSVQFLSGLMKVLASGAVLVSFAFEVVGKEIARTLSAIVNVANGRFEEAFEDVKGNVKDLMNAASGAMDKWNTIWTASAKSPDKVAKATNDASDKMVAALERQKKALAESETSMKALEKVAVELELKVATFGFNELGVLEANLNMGELAKHLEKVGDKAEAMRSRILEAAQVLADLKVDLKMGEIKFTVARTNTASDLKIADMIKEFGQVTSGATQTDITRANTAGFRDFDEALRALAEQTDRNAKALGEAELAKELGDIEGVRNATLLADNTKRAAEMANKAADAFVDLAKQAIAKQREIVGMALNVLGSIGEHGKDVANLMQSAMQGFQAGGIWGAIIAVIANLFSKLESVAQFIDTVFGQFMDGFSQLNGSFTVLFRSLTDSLEPVMKGLAMTFKVLDQILTPIFEAMEEMMKPFEDLANGLLELLESTGILGFVIKLVSGVFTMVGIVISVLVLGIQYLWAGVLRMVRGIIWLFTAGQGTKEIDKTIEEHDKAIKQNRDNIDRKGASIGKDPQSTDVEATGDVTATGAVTVTGPVTIEAPPGTTKINPNDNWSIFANGSEAGADYAREFARSSTLLSGGTTEAADAAGQAAYDAFLGLGGVVDKAAAALNKFSQSLTNVPAGFKYQLRAFDAQSGIGGQLAETLQGDETRGNVTVHVAGSVVSENQLIELIQNLQRKSNFRTTGTNSTANFR